VAIEGLAGLETSRGPLRLDGVRRGRFPEERDAEVYVGVTAQPVIRLKHFAGRRSANVSPWIEATVDRDDGAFLAELVAALAGLLPPGGYLMIGYGGDETEVGLKRRFPPVATPIGTALYEAGATWFKDWYYPEGWMEGGFKLQGNLARSDESAAANRASIRAEVIAWLADSSDADEVLERARRRGAAVLADEPSRARDRRRP
jgi:hypothetical protein